jgi:chromosome partitioning protein
MIITFATQKGGTGKTTLAIAFANYISGLSERKIKVYDFDFQKSFYYKWKEDEQSDLPKLYEVETIGEDEEQPFSDFETLINLKESEKINLFDLAGTLDQKYGGQQPFRTYYGMKYQGGYSDHLPVYAEFRLIY